MSFRYKTLVVKSFAKVNLYLRVLGKRKDNFHNLATLFARIDLSDRIVLKNREDGRITIKCASPHVPKDETNLCYRAADLLRQECKLKRGLDIEIDKKIPVGAGLGGGSSDAAGVLVGLNRLWRLRLGRPRLAALASKLGSDVPFFIYDTKFALGSGRGDKIKPLSSLHNVKLWFILVYPGIHVSTPLIYRKFDLYMSGKSRREPLNKGISRLTRQIPDVKIILSELSKKGSPLGPESLFNDLESVTSRIYPVVGKVKNALLTTGLRRVMMSGSGPAVFAICDCRAQAMDLCAKLRQKHKSWQIFLISAV
jgi:4-diphosphocytidyl-2C-methyl-D-erythritol kinase